MARAETVFGGKSNPDASLISSCKLAGALEKASRSLCSMEVEPTFFSV